MNKQYEHFAAAAKITAFRQKRRQQQGVLTQSGNFRTSAAPLFFPGPRSLECAFRYVRSAGSFQMPATFSNRMMGFEIAESNHVLRFYCGGAFREVTISENVDYHVVISFDGETVCGYLNGELVGSFPPKAYDITNVFTLGASAGNGYPFMGTVYLCRHYDYALSAAEVATLWNGGDPAGYPLPAYYKGKGNGYISDFSSGTDGWRSQNANTVCHAEDGVLVVEPTGDMGDLSIINQLPFVSNKYHRYYVEMEFAVPLDGNIRRLTIFPWTGYAPLTVTDFGDTSFVAGITSVDAQQRFNTNSFILFQQVNTPQIFRIRSIRFIPVGCVAEYLPQNLAAGGPGERAPVEITGNASYTWTGVDDATYSVKIGTSRTPVQGQWYLIKGSVSEYEAGVPYISADTGYTEFALPRANGEFAVFAQCRSTSPTPYLFTFRGGNRGTERRLTVSVDSIEPVNDIAAAWLDSAGQLPFDDSYLPPLPESAGGHDMSVNGTPEIRFGATLTDVWQRLEPMSLEGFRTWNPGPGDVPVQIAGGAIRVTGCQRENTYSGGAYALLKAYARPGDRVEFSFEARRTGKLASGFFGLSDGGNIYYVDAYSLTDDFQKFTRTIDRLSHAVDTFWASKRYGDAEPGTIDVKNIIVKIYRK